MEQVFSKYFDDVFSSLREPLVLLDNDFKVVKANRAFYLIFGVKPEETEGVVIYELGNRQWDIPRLRELLETILPRNTIFNDFEVEHTFEKIGLKIMHLNARRIYRKKNKSSFVLLAIEDVTEREYYKRHLEELVAKRTAELSTAREMAEANRQVAETALTEIKQLKDQLEAERAYLQEEIKLEFNHDNIVGRSDAIKYVFYKIEQIARTDTSVLVLGETGTGKELVARAIHGMSDRKHRALVKMNCAALPATLIESELFGHEKGAFTGAQTKESGALRLPTVPRCFSMKLANCRWNCNQNCCRLSKVAGLRGWAAPRQGMAMYASLPRPIGISKRRFAREDFGRISGIG